LVTNLARALDAAGEFFLRSNAASKRVDRADAPEFQLGHDLPEDQIQQRIATTDDHARPHCPTMRQVITVDEQFGTHTAGLCGA
jgi:hypothetical protein